MEGSWSARMKRVLGLLLALLLQGCLGQESIGCFKSSSLYPDLPVLVARRVGSPDECIKECKARYYM